jgi:sialidase-1
MTNSLRVLFGLVAAVAGPAAAADPPPPERTDLFTAGKDGYVLYRIPGIVVTAKGTVLAYCEARKSESGDWAPST